MNTTDTVKAKLTPGEFVIRKEAVDMIGVPMLEKLNGMPEEGGGHSAIDRIIQMATLQNMQPMYSGGEVEPNFSGDMQGMMGGGYMKPQQYQEGGQAFVEPEIRRNNPNLGIDPYMRYEILEGKPMMNEPLYDKSDALVDRLIQGGAEMSDIIPYKERKDFKRYVESGEGNARDEMLLRKLLDAMPKPSRIKRKGEADLANMNFLAKKGYDRMREDILQEENRPMGDLRKAQEGREDILYNILDTSNFFNKEDGGLLSYQDGGEVPGYQDGGQPQQDDAQVQAMVEQQAMMQQQPQPNQFVPFDQRPNQNPATGNWGESGDYMQAIRAEKDSLDMQDKEILRQKALNAFQRIRLDSLAEQGIPSDVGAINSDAMGSYSRPDSASMSIDRNKGQYFQQQVMQRSPYDSTTRSNSYKEGLESVLQGMFQGDNNRGIYR